MNKSRAALRFSLTSSLALALMMAAPPASAQTDEQRAGARSLATEGVSAFNEGRFSDAAELFEKAESLMHAPTHLLFLARSDAKLGRYVKAREAYLKIVKEQLPSSAPQAFRDAQTTADTEVRTIEPKIARLKIKLDGGQGATDLTLKIDGEVLPAVLIGASQPLDPGEHTVEILARGKSAAPQKVTLTEGGAAVVTLKLVDDPNAAPVPAAAPSGNGPVAQPAEGAPPSDTGVSKPGQGLRIASYSAFGVGVVGLGVGTLFLLQKGSKEKDLDKQCTLPGGACPLDAKPLHDSANTAGTLSVVGFAAGGVGIAAGVTLFLLSNKQSSPTTAHITPWVDWRSAGVSGVF